MLLFVAQHLYQEWKVDPDISFPRSKNMRLLAKMQLLIAGHIFSKMEGVICSY